MLPVSYCKTRATRTQVSGLIALWKATAAPHVGRGIEMDGYSSYLMQTRYEVPEWTIPTKIDADWPMACGKMNGWLQVAMGKSAERAGRL